MAVKQPAGKGNASPRVKSIRPIILRGRMKGTIGFSQTHSSHRYQFVALKSKLGPHVSIRQRNMDISPVQSQKLVFRHVVKIKKRPLLGFERYQRPANYGIPSHQMRQIDSHWG